MTLHFNRGSQRAKRKALRRNASDAEQRLWQHLRGKQLGTRFRRQYSVDVYVLDFYGPRSKLAIEVDGDSHFTAAAIRDDHERTTYLKGFGIEVLRFIEHHCGSRQAPKLDLPLAPSLSKEGGNLTEYVTAILTGCT